MSFVTLLSLSPNDVSLVPSSLNLVSSKSLISSKLSLPVAAMLAALLPFWMPFSQFEAIFYLNINKIELFFSDRMEWI